MSEPLLRTEHLSRVAGGRAIVDDISVAVVAGDVIAVTGPSGSGKSSFLRLLNRLDEPTAGTVWVEGRDYRSLPPRTLRRRVGMVLQTPVLFPGSVADNIAFGPRQRGETLDRRSIDELLAQVGLAGFADRDAGRLSGGEAQRVSLARTLANGPEILLLDEPTSALDETAKSGVEALVCALIRQRSLTCLMVTHDAAQAARMATRQMVIEHGRVSRFDRAGERLHA